VCGEGGVNISECRVRLGTYLPRRLHGRFGRVERCTGNLGSIPGGGKVGGKVKGQGGGHGLLSLSPPFGAGRQTGKNG